MHDTPIEDRLRGALRSEVDSLQLSITVDDVNERLAERRRARSSQRALAAVAAAIAVAVVGATVILSVPDRRASVAASPSGGVASPSASASRLPMGGIPSGMPSQFVEPGGIPPYPGWALVAIVGGTSGAGGDAEPSVTGFTVTKDVSLLLVSANCRGAGSLEIEVTGGAAMDVPCPTLSHDPRRSFVEVTDSAEMEVRITFTGVVEYHSVRIEGSDARLPERPTITADRSLVGSARTDAVPGCGISFQLASGMSGADQCGPEYPVIPVDRALTVSPGLQLLLELQGGWGIAGISGALVETDALIASPATVSFQPLDRCCDTGEAEPATAIFWAPTEAGDWTIMLTTSAIREGDRFTLPYYVRVIVEP